MRSCGRSLSLSLWLCCPPVALRCARIPSVDFGREIRGFHTAPVSRWKPLRGLNMGPHHPIFYCYITYACTMQDAGCSIQEEPPPNRHATRRLPSTFTPSQGTGSRTHRGSPPPTMDGYMSVSSAQGRPLQVMRGFPAERRSSAQTSCSHEQVARAAFFPELDFDEYASARRASHAKQLRYFQGGAAVARIHDQRSSRLWADHKNTVQQLRDIAAARWGSNVAPTALPSTPRIPHQGREEIEKARRDFVAANHGLQLAFSRQREAQMAEYHYRDATKALIAVRRGF